MIMTVRRDRHGFLMPMAVTITIVLSIYFLSYSLLSQSQLHSSKHFLEISQVVSLADTGARWGISVLSDLKRRSSCVDATSCEELFRAGQTQGAFDIRLPPDVTEYVSEVQGKLQITATWRMQPFSVSTSGFSDDPGEKEGEIEVRSVATIGTAKRSVVIKRGIKTCVGVHPVLSKFTLFVKRRPADEQLNCLLKMTEKRNYDNGFPLILINGSESVPVRPVFTLPALDSIESRNGWVFLHSETSEPWSFQVAGSGIDDEFDDSFFLPRSFIENRTISNAWNQRLSANGSACRVEKLYEYFDGFKGSYTFESTDYDMTVVPASQYFKTRFFFPDPSAPPKTALIRLWGTGSRCHPTLVLGPVTRKYFRFRKMDCVIPPKSYNTPPGKVDVPGFPDADSFVSTFLSPPSGQITKTKVSNGTICGSTTVERNYTNDFVLYAAIFGVQLSEQSLRANWDKIRTACSYIVQEPLIQGFSYLYAWKDGASEIQDPPPDPFQKLSLWSQADGSLFNSLYQGKGRLLRQGKPLYEGELSKIDGIRELEARITSSFASPHDLWKAVLRKRNQLCLNGITLVRAPLLIAQDLVIRKGGILIVKGNVTIQGSITSFDGEPLTIVSTADITVDSRGSPVHAHLICLRGNLMLKGKTHIRGSVAAGQLDFGSLMSHDEKFIEFAPEHSFPDCSNMSLHRVVLTPEEDCRVAVE